MYTCKNRVLFPIVLISVDVILGWWFVTYNGMEGWAPSSFLERENTSGVGQSVDEEQCELISVISEASGTSTNMPCSTKQA